MRRLPVRRGARSGRLPVGRPARRERNGGRRRPGACGPGGGAHHRDRARAPAAGPRFGCDRAGGRLPRAADPAARARAEVADAVAPRTPRRRRELRPRLPPGARRTRPALPRRTPALTRHAADLPSAARLPGRVPRLPDRLRPSARRPPGGVRDRRVRVAVDGILHVLLPGPGCRLARKRRPGAIGPAGRGRTAGPDPDEPRAGGQPGDPLLQGQMGGRAVPALPGDELDARFSPAASRRETGRCGGRSHAPEVAGPAGCPPGVLEFAAGENFRPSAAAGLHPGGGHLPLPGTLRLLPPHHPAGGLGVARHGPRDLRAARAHAAPDRARAPAGLGGAAAQSRLLRHGGPRPPRRLRGVHDHLRPVHGRRHRRRAGGERDRHRRLLVGGHRPGEQPLAGGGRLRPRLRRDRPAGVRPRRPGAPTARRSTSPTSCWPRTSRPCAGCPR